MKPFACDCGARFSTRTAWWAHQIVCANGRGRELETWHRQMAMRFVEVKKRNRINEALRKGETALDVLLGELRPARKKAKVRAR